MKIAALLALVLAAASCSAPSLGVTPRLGALSAEGEMGFSSGGVTAVDQDVEDAFGLEKDSSVLGARVDLSAGPMHLTFSGQASDHDGSGTLNADVEYDGSTLPAGTNVQTEFSLTSLGFVSTWDLIPTDLFELGLGLGVNGIGIDTRIVDSAGLLDPVEFDELAPIPVVALRVGGAIGPVSIEGLASGLSLSIGDVDATYYDIDLMAKWKLIGAGITGSIAGGYRYMRLDASFEDGNDAADIDLTFSGPWIGATVGF